MNRVVRICAAAAIAVRPPRRRARRSVRAHDAPGGARFISGTILTKPMKVPSH